MEAADRHQRMIRRFAALAGAIALAYLIYKLFVFSHWDQLMDSFSEGKVRWSYLLFVIALLPVNYILEALKWQKVARYVTRLSLLRAFLSVVAGASTGFITPNRTGEIAGRMRFLQLKTIHEAWSPALINSLTQNAAILIAGLPSLIVFSVLNYEAHVSELYFLLLALLLVLGTALLLLLPWLSNRFHYPWIQRYLPGIENYSHTDLLTATFISLLRFGVFNLQLLGVFLFLRVDFQLVDALIALPASYLIVTFTPSLAWSELIVRGSTLVYFSSFFGYPAAISMLAAGVLWLINSALPAALGSLALFRGLSLKKG